MVNINFGTGLASLLGGFAKAQANTNNQDWAKEQREEEIRKAERERVQRANDIIGFVGKYTTGEPNPKAEEEIEAEDLKRGWGGIAPQYYGTIAKAKSSQPYKLNESGNIAYDENNEPIISGWYSPTYKPTPYGQRADIEANRWIRQEGWYDPIIDKWQTDPNNPDKPLLKETTGEPIKVRNPNDVKGKGSSTFIFTPQSNQYIKNKADKLISERNDATKYSQSLGQNPRIAKNYISEANKLWKSMQNNDGTIKTNPETNQPYTEEDAKQQAVRNISDRYWKKANNLGDDFRALIGSILPNNPKAKKYYDENIKNFNKDDFWDGVIKGYSKGELDNHDVNVLSNAYLSITGERPSKEYYNVNDKEFELNPEDIKEEKKSKTKKEEPAPTIKAKPLDTSGKTKKKKYNIISVESTK